MQNPPAVVAAFTSEIVEIGLRFRFGELDAPVDQFPDARRRFFNDKFYDDTIFHRVIDNFMIQGGGFTADMKQKTAKDPIKNEASNGLKNERGTLAMARTNIIDSATCQFFINTVNNTRLDTKHPVFGEVIEGMDVVDAIGKVKTDSNDRPLTEVTIIRAIVPV